MATIRPEPFGGDDLDEFDPDFYISNVLDVIEDLTGCKVFSCDGDQCGQTIMVFKDKPIPKFCTLCGNQIDWGRLLEDKFDVCPKCKKEYPQDRHDYCDVDGTRLERKN